MNLFQLFTQDGHTLKKKTANEYAGACPSCGDNDRFIVQTDKGRYWCRQCNKTGDAVQYHRDFRGMTYQEACLLAGHSTRFTGLLQKKAIKSAWTPKTANTTSEAWQNKAQVFVDYAQKQLKEKPDAMKWLYDSRGLTDQTIQRARIGWNPKDHFRDRETWGLEAALNEKGGPKKLWLPAGIVIPCYTDGKPGRLRIRRSEPGDGPRYVLIPGSSSAPMAWGLDKKVFVIVESELDGLLLWQEAGGIVGVIALGSAQARPDSDTHKALAQAEIILVSLDADSSGAKESWQFWAEHYRHVKRWPVPCGKDPGEARQQGIDMRVWIEAGLDGDQTIDLQGKLSTSQPGGSPETQPSSVLRVPCVLPNVGAVRSEEKETHGAVNRAVTVANSSLDAPYALGLTCPWCKGKEI